MKCLVLASMLSAMFAVATDPDLSARSAEGIEQVVGLLQSERQLQSSCFKSSSTMYTAYSTLGNAVSSAIQRCAGLTSCYINWASYSGYRTFKDACISAKGAFATYKVTMNCGSTTFVFSNVPNCFVSKKINSSCNPEYLDDDVADSFDNDGCYTSAYNQAYTDYSGNKPVKKPTKWRKRRALLE
jgi:hypothetical protein